MQRVSLPPSHTHTNTRTESIGKTGVKLRGVVALCPLIATDSAQVPLDMDLAEDFAKMLSDVSPQGEAILKTGSGVRVLVCLHAGTCVSRRKFDEDF